MLKHKYTFIPEHAAEHDSAGKKDAPSGEEAKKKKKEN